jgi:hypothetical protein
VVAVCDLMGLVAITAREKTVVAVCKDGKVVKEQSISTAQFTAQHHIKLLFLSSYMHPS